MPDYDLGTAHGQVRIAYDSGGITRARADLARLQRSFDEGGDDAARFTRVLGNAGESAGRQAGAFRRLGATVGRAMSRARGEAAETNRSLDDLIARLDAMGRRRIFVNIAVAGAPAAIASLTAVTTGAIALGTTMAGLGAGIAAFSSVAAPAMENVSTAVEELNTEGKISADTMKALTAEQRKLVPVAHTLSQNWRELRASLEPAVLGTVANAMGLLTDNMELLPPLVTETSAGLNTLIGRLGEAANQPWFESLHSTLVSSINPTLDKLGTIAIQSARGLAGLFEAFYGAMGQGILTWLANMATRFADWAQNLQGSPEFEAFMAYVRDVGPMVVEMLKQLGITLQAVGVAAAPLGPIYLQVLTTLLQLVAGFAQAHPQAMALLIAFGSLTSIAKSLIVPLITVGKFVRTLVGGLAAAARGMYRLGASMALGTRLQLLGLRLRAAGAAALRFGRRMIVASAQGVAAGARMAGRAIASAAIFTGRWIWMGAVAMRNALRIAAAWLIAMGPVGWITAAIMGLVAVFAILWRRSAAFRGFWKMLWRGIRAAAAAVVAWFRGPFVGFFTSIPAFFKGLWNRAVGVFEWARGRVVAAARALAAWVIRQIQRLQVMAGIVRGYASAALGVFGWLRDRAVAIVRSAAQWVITQIERLRVIGAIIRNAFGNAVSAAQSAIGRLVSVAASIPGRVASAVGNLGGMLVSAGRDLIMGLVNGIKGAVGAAADAAADAAKAAIGAAKSFLGIGSPSRVFEALGRDTVRGMVRGIDRQMPELTRIARSMSAATIPPNAGAGRRSTAAASPAAAAAEALIGGDLVVQTGPGGDVREGLEEALFQLRRARRGGLASR